MRREALSVSQLGPVSGFLPSSEEVSYIPISGIDGSLIHSETLSIAIIDEESTTLFSMLSSDSAKFHPWNINRYVSLLSCCSNYFHNSMFSITKLLLIWQCSTIKICIGKR